MPTGRLMKNTQRQLKVSVSQPPKRRADDRPDHDAGAPDRHRLAVLSFGLMSSRTVCDSGTIAAPNTPCSRRNTTISSRLQAMPQSIEVTVKPTTEIRNSSLRPKRSDSQPVTGVMIAAATM